MDRHNPKVEYSPQLQGVRAVAVLLVLATHASVPGMNGGFIGVDMFFVISGYLITGILLTEFRVNKGIALSTFYLRRFKRLAPGLLLMVFLTSLTMNYILTLPDLQHQFSGAASAAVWVSNFQFGLSGLDYFDGEQIPSAFLHTWSLGVEEQFYLFWPLFLLLTLRLYPSKLTHFLIFSFAISLALCLWLSIKTPILSFYMMPTRIWQFSAGALVWVWRPKILSNPTWSRYLYPVAITMLLSALALANPERAYPDWLATLPTAATALLLAALISGPNKLIAKILAYKPLVLIGDLSYSLYLWHWPIVIFGIYLLGEDTPVNRLKLVTLSIPLAWLSYRFIERPCRDIQVNKLPRQVKLLLLSLTILSVGAILLGWQQHLTHKNAELMASDNALGVARTRMSDVYKNGCDQWYLSNEVMECTFGSPTSPRTAVLWGDSIGTQWYPAIRKALNKNDWRIIVITKSSCPIVNHTVYLKAIGRDFSECDEWKWAAAARIKEIEPDLLFIGSAGTYPFSNEEWENGSRDMLNTVDASAKEIIILEPTMPLGFSGPECIASHGGTQQVGSSITSICSATVSPDNITLGWQAVKKAANGFANVRVLNLNKLICPNIRCQAMVDQQVIYRDAQHMTLDYAEALSSYFRQIIFTVGTPKPVAEAHETSR